MKKNVLAIVGEDEKREIQDLYERINALNSLSITLAESNVVFIENSDFYSKIVEDLVTSKKKYQLWWLEMSEKYGLDKSVLEKTQIDFISNTIFIQN